jgi:BCCT family betaine/carnitine transporter
MFPFSKKYFGVLEGLIAITLFLVGRNSTLTALQAMTASTGLPFTIILLAMCYSVYKGLNEESKKNL